MTYRRFSPQVAQDQRRRQAEVARQKKREAHRLAAALEEVQRKRELERERRRIEALLAKRLRQAEALRRREEKQRKATGAKRRAATRSVFDFYRG